MKNILIVILIGLSLSVSAQVRIGGAILQTSSADNYATHYDTTQYSGFRVVSTIAQRNSIKSSYRSDSMWVYVRQTDSVYQLIGGKTNSNWKSRNFGSGGVTASFVNNKVKWQDSSNVYIGKRASVPPTGRNISIGEDANYLNIGANNYSIGYGAGYSASGYRNYAFGESAGGRNGNYNISIGYAANILSSNTGTISIGSYAGEQNTADSCIFIGWNQGQDNVIPGKISIDPTRTAKPLIDGFAIGDSLIINGKLNVKGDILKNGVPIGGGGGSSFTGDSVKKYLFKQGTYTNSNGDATISGGNLFLVPQNDSIGRIDTTGHHIGEIIYFYSTTSFKMLYNRFKVTPYAPIRDISNQSGITKATFAATPVGFILTPSILPGQRTLYPYWNKIGNDLDTMLVKAIISRSSGSSSVATSLVNSNARVRSNGLFWGKKFTTDSTKRDSTMATLKYVDTHVSGGITITSNIYNVDKAGNAPYHSVQTAINAANAGSTVYVYPGFYDEEITLKNRVNIIGIGDVTLRCPIGSDFWVLTSTLDTCTISGVTIQGLKLATFTTSSISLSKVTFTSFLKGIEQNSLWVGQIVIDSTQLQANSTDIINCGFGNPFTIKKHSNVQWSGSKYFVEKTLLLNNSILQLNVELFDQLPGGGSYDNFVLGTVNPYDSNVQGTSTVYSDKNNSYIPQWKAWNNLDSSQLDLTIQSVKIAPQLACYQKTKLTIKNSDLINKVTGTGTQILPQNESVTKIQNSVLQRISGINGSYVIDVDNSSVYYDSDLTPWNGSGNIYNSSNWPNYSQGTHAIELSDFFNKDIVPMLHLRNTSVTMMGDDVLNSLVDTVALKNLEVNFTYKSTTTAKPSNPTVIGFWATGQSYTAGQIYKKKALIEQRDTGCFIVVSNHTSSADISTDIAANKIRPLFGANKQANGYYQQLYFTGTVWKALFKLGKWQGGRFRNRGSVFAIYHGNYTLDNVVINDNVRVWSWQSGTSPMPGTFAYPNCVSGGVDYTTITNSAFNLYGDYCDKPLVTAFLIPTIDANKAQTTFKASGLSITGRHLDAGLKWAVTRPVPYDKIYLNAISFNCSDTLYPDQKINDVYPILGSNNSLVTTSLSAVDSIKKILNFNLINLGDVFTYGSQTVAGTLTVNGSKYNSYGLTEWLGLSPLIAATGVTHDTLLITINFNTPVDWTSNGAISHAKFFVDMWRYNNPTCYAELRPEYRTMNMYGSLTTDVAVNSSTLGGNCVDTPSFGVLSNSVVGYNSQLVLYLKNNFTVACYAHLKLIESHNIKSITLSIK